MKVSLSAKDSDALKVRGWNEKSIELQRSQLLSGGQPVSVVSACESGDGIAVLDFEQRAEAQKAFERSKKSGSDWIRFVPASGAASRMFSGMVAPRSPSIEQQLQKQAAEFPFWTEDQQKHLMGLSEEERPNQAVVWMMDPEKGWSRLPKGLIPFHQTDNGLSQNSFQEHTSEWRGLMGEAPMHFTVPAAFRRQIESVMEATGHREFSTSVQLPSTDTVAWDRAQSDLARHADGSLLLRQGGHGALLKNLDAIVGDFICLRNIDNVVPTWRMDLRNQEQIILMGECVRLTEERNALIFALEKEEDQAFETALKWLEGFDKNAALHVIDKATCLAAMNRPLRVAGMVQNTGEPGGGPFWVRQSNGWLSPAIVESAELPDSMKGKGTHFNPVDIICSVAKPDQSGKYRLEEFADHSMFFTAQKDWQGKSIRILELPGLWNGAMALWLTRFVEVPNATFAPVKTVEYLLRKDRRAERI